LLDLFLQWYCVCEVNLRTYSASRIWHCTLGNGFDLLLLDGGRIGTLWGIMSH
jgi:hypothetical protein